MANVFNIERFVGVFIAHRRSVLGRGLMLCLVAALSHPLLAKDSSSARIKALSQHPQINSALQKAVSLEKSDNPHRLIKLTETEAPPFGEQKRAQLFADYLRQSGLKEVFIDKAGNVIGIRPGTSSAARNIGISAHLDTVFPAGTDVSVKVSGNRFTAPGIGDNTRGLVMILSVLDSLQHAQIQTRDNLLFIGNVGEEGLGDLRGVRFLMSPQSTVKLDELLVVDGGATNRVVTGGVGSHRYRVTFKGPGGHSWGAFGLANPHHALGRAIAHFDQRAAELEHSTQQKVSHNIGRIGGGTSVNSIPFESWFEVDMRSASQALIDQMDKRLRQSVQQALAEENAGKQRGPALTVDIKPVGRRPAAKGNPEWALRRSVFAAFNLLGIKPRETSSSTDASIPISLGIPALTISRGGKGGKAHSLDEYWINEKAYLPVQAAILTLAERAGLEKAQR